MTHDRPDFWPDRGPPDWQIVAVLSFVRAGLTWEQAVMIAFGYDETASAFIARMMQSRFSR